jgi:hypothetical protein
MFLGHAIVPGRHIVVVEEKGRGTHALIMRMKK